MKTLLKFKKAISLIMTVCMLFSFAACAEEAAGSDEAYTHLTVGSTTHLDGRFFTSYWGNGSSDRDVRKLLFAYDPIVWSNEEGMFVTDNTVVSGLVVMDDAETGNRTYEFVLQNDLTYSDGTPITASDYVFSWLLRYSPVLAQLGAALPNENAVVGSEAYRNGETDVLAGIHLISDNCFSVTVDAGYLPFFYELGLVSIEPYPIYVIAPDCAVADDGEGAYITNSRKFNQKVLNQTIFAAKTGYMSHPSVVSGPYVLTAFDGETAEFARNPYYRGNQNGIVPQIETLTFGYSNNEDMLGKLDSGELDLLNKCTNVQLLQNGIALAAENGYGMSNYTRTGLSYIAFACERPAVSDAAVRHAIACCVNKDGLVADYVGNYGLRADGYYGIGQWMTQMINGTMPPPVQAPEENASEEEQAAYDKAMAAWAELSMDSLKTYTYDVDEAIKELEAAGWTLNGKGKAYSGKPGEVRAKKIGKKLVSLSLKLVCPEGNAIADSMEENLVVPLAQAGIQLTIERVSWSQLLRYFYRQTKRDCDMMFLATNFDVLFDPSDSFAYADGVPATSNNTAIQDEALYRTTVEMRNTQPGDTLSYCRNWLAFQDAFTEAMPMIPIYSNVYFDFYNPMLRNYLITETTTWSEAIVAAYLSDAPDAEEAAEGEEEQFE